jgi:hypothetical protein
MFYKYNLVLNFLFVKRNISKMFMNLFLNSTLVCNDFFGSQADKLASKKKVNTEALIDRALVAFLTENEGRIDPALMKRKIELGINEIIDFIKTLDPQAHKRCKQ